MNPISLIPSPDTIPAPAWLFSVLNVLTFALHIVVINVMLGGILITLFSRLSGNDLLREQTLHGAVAGKIPTTFALGVNLGVAPLLFIQVLYGQFIYTSSVLMAVFWILVIPLLMLAYYGSYIHIRRYEKSPLLSKTALVVTAFFVLYIGFMLTNNMTLMLHPEQWDLYFANRQGTLLNLGDRTLWPRYLHFLTASIAIGGLFIALVWQIRRKSDPDRAVAKIKSGLKLFAIATSIQVAVGVWFLLSQPKGIMMAFMGGNPTYTIILALGILLALGSIYVAFKGKLVATLLHLIGILTMMVISRANLRTLYLQPWFKLSDLELAPQYGVMALFFAVFIIGLIAVGIMIKMAVVSKGRATS